MSRKTKTLQLLYERDRGDGSINLRVSTCLSAAPASAGVVQPRAKGRDRPSRPRAHRSKTPQNPTICCFCVLIRVPKRRSPLVRRNAGSRR